MDRDHVTHEAELELQRLEQRIDELILTCERLREENWALRSQQHTFTARRVNLVDRHEMARSRVEAMITRLKAMERGT